MKEIKFMINYGGYSGCDDECSIYVDDNATEYEIENEIWKEFEERVIENCSWELIEEDEEEI